MAVLDKLAAAPPGPATQTALEVAVCQHGQLKLCDHAKRAGLFLSGDMVQVTDMLDTASYWDATCRGFSTFDTCELNEQLSHQLVARRTRCAESCRREGQDNTMRQKQFRANAHNLRLVRRSCPAQFSLTAMQLVEDAATCSKCYPTPTPQQAGQDKGLALARQQLASRFMRFTHH
jgi:hypothetical protein